MIPIPFQTIKWTDIESVNYPGITGNATWQTVLLNGLRIRMVTYSANYLADHWCQKGHFVHCLSGEFKSELSTGEIYTLSPGMSYIVTDDSSTHRSSTEKGVVLLIIDGDFLRSV